MGWGVTVPKSFRSRLGSSLIAIVSALAAPVSQADDKAADAFPDKPIRIVVTFPPGGGTDVLARLIASELTKVVNQPVLVENRPGASGNIGADHVAKSPPDGLTLLAVNSSYAINPGVFKKMPFNPATDLRGVYLFASVPSVISVPESSKIMSLKDLIDTAKGGRSLTYASCGPGTPQHLAGGMLEISARINLQHISYKGCAPAITDVLAGQVELGINTLANTVPHLNAKKLRALAVTSKRRTPQLPDVPAVSEFGLTDYDVDQWFGILAPARTPDSITQKLYREMSRVLGREDMQARLAQMGYNTANVGPAEFQRIMVSDIERFGQVTRSIGLSLDN